MTNQTKPFDFFKRLRSTDPKVIVSALDRLRNRILSPNDWPTQGRLLKLPSDYPVARAITQVHMTPDEAFTWYDRVAASGGRETVWSLLGFIHGSHVTIARSYTLDHKSMPTQTELDGNPEFSEMIVWYFYAWSQMQKQGIVPADVFLDYVGSGHNHPPHVFHRLSTPADTGLYEEADTVTIGRALQQMSLYVAPLCRMEEVAVPSSVYLLKDNKIARVVRPAPELAVKIFTATCHSPQPVLTELKYIPELPYALPPLSWHVVHYRRLAALQAKLQKEATTLQWSIRTDEALPLPYVHFVVQNPHWVNSVIIQITHDFPRSKPQIFLVSQYEFATAPPEPLNLNGIWDGSDEIGRILDSLKQKGHLNAPPS